MLFSDIAILDENFEVQTGCWVGTVEGRIAYIGTEAPTPEEAARFGEVYDGDEKLLVPGMFNAHSHAPMTLLRGYAENLPLQTWLNDRVFPFEAKITDEDAYWATVLACAEMLRYGTVSFSDMYYHSRERVRAVTECGMKMNACEGLLAFEDKPYAEYPISALNEELIAEFHGSAEGRILIDYNIHAEYTSTPAVCADIAALAKAKSLNIHVHVSETKSEHEECKGRHGGLTPVRYFDSLGVFDVPVTAAHCVWVDDGDIDILAERGAFVASNPVSNMKLGSGFAPIARMLERGVSVALGTDGVASNNNLDMYQDLFVLALAQKGANLDPTAVSPAGALRAATRTGALSQGRADCGHIALGAKADLAVLDASGPSWCPATDLLNNLVYAGHGSDVCLTMVDGEVLYRDGVWETIDVERAKAEVEVRTRRIIASV
ncbi:amidohydrolase [Raoultibacter phocaeensis]|uniref:amidohydrolase n=1 Tax=Raoultibacter phocaeensis TaxID=2479841 RepID=UPI00111A15B5|nr:amidohydrolase [Raoultibacter phocaeensis]